MNPVNRDQVIERLNHFVNREAHSLSSYVLEAEPYVTPEQTFAMKELQGVAAQERKRAAELREMMYEQLRAAPADRHFPPIVADMNYLSLPYLLGLIVRGKETLIQEYETFLALTGGLAEWAAVREDVAKCAEASRYDLEHLRSLLSRLIAAKNNGKKAADAAMKENPAASE